MVLRWEMSQLGGDLKNVKQSVINMRTQVQKQLASIHTEWYERMDNRFRGIQTELNNQIEKLLSGSFTSQISVVNQQIRDIQERMNLVQNVTQTTKNQTRGRIRDLKRRLRNSKTKL